MEKHEPVVNGTEEEELRIKRLLSFLHKTNAQKKLVASICRGSPLVAKSGIAKGRHLIGFHLDKEYPDLVIRPIVEANGGIWIDDKPVVVDGNLASSGHPNDIERFVGGIRGWLSQHSKHE